MREPECHALVLEELRAANSLSAKGRYRRESDGRAEWDDVAQKNSAVRLLGLAQKIKRDRLAWHASRPSGPAFFRLAGGERRKEGVWGNLGTLVPPRWMMRLLHGRFVTRRRSDPGRSSLALAMRLPYLTAHDRLDVLA